VQNTDNLKISTEIIRKLIHFGCSIFPILYLYLLNREQIVIICVSITVLFGVAELIRYKTEWGNTLFRKIFYPLLREGEKGQNLTGATYLFLSVTVTFLIFEKHIAIPAVLILTVADSLAAIVGKIFGTHEIGNKSWEGSATFFIISFILLNIFIPGFTLYMLIVALVVSLVELLPIPPGDNIWITLTAGIMLSLVV
jgi:dolichol kinase